MRPDNQLSSIVCHSDEIAILNDSIDLFISSFYMETLDQPTAYLHEIQRILVPKGIAIFIGLNQKRTFLTRLTQYFKNTEFKSKKSQAFIFMAQKIKLVGEKNAPDSVCLI